MSGVLPIGVDGVQKHRLGGTAKHRLGASSIKQRVLKNLAPTGKARALGGADDMSSSAEGNHPESGFGTDVTAVSGS